MSLKRYLSIGILGSLWACDMVVNKDATVPGDPQIPQAVIESVRALNSNMSDVNLTRLANGELWQADFSTSSYRSLLFIDDTGEILFENKLVGKPQQLPTTVRDEANRIAQEGFIESASVIQRDAQTTLGYFVEVKLKDGQVRKLRFNSANALETNSPTTSTLRVTDVYLTTTEQIKDDARIPATIRQFFGQNQFPGSNVAVYVYEDKTAKIVLTNYQLTNKSIITTEVLLAADGQVLEWIAPLEKEISYEISTQNDTPASVNSLLTAQAPGWTWEYTVMEQQFGKTAQWKTRGKNAAQETLWATLDYRSSVSFVTKSSAISSGEVPAAAKQYLDSQWSGWQWNKGRKLQQVNKNSPEKYIIEVKTNGDVYVVLFDGTGKWLYQYKKNA
ncbi:hypothetical protein [Runella sp.]|uniref:hypothetical protein n=1 Tax=Runella sp. TaxID=1960881 RepID=UPI003D098D07